MAPIRTSALFFLATLFAVVCAANHQISIHGVAVPVWVPSLFNGALIGIGAVELLLGYRLFKVTLFVLGLVSAGLVVGLLALDGTHSLWASVALGAIAGLLVGGTGAAIPKIGVFLVGATLGLVAGECLRVTVLGHLPATYALAAFIVITIVLGLGFGALSIYAMRATVIVSTGVIGAFSIFRGISMLLIPLGVTMLPTTEAQVKAGLTNAAPVWGSIAGVALLAACGIVVQFRFTSKKQGEADEKDEWETEVEQSEISLAALTGSKGAKKNKKKSKKKNKKSKGGGVSADALLLDQEEGSEFYEAPSDSYLDPDGYYDDGLNSAEWEEGPAAPIAPPKPAKSWWSSKSKKAEQIQPEAAEVEW